MTELICFLWDMVAIAAGLTAIAAMTRFAVWIWSKKSGL